MLFYKDERFISLILGYEAIEHRYKTTKFGYETAMVRISLSQAVRPGFKFAMSIEHLKTTIRFKRYRTKTVAQAGLNNYPQHLTLPVDLPMKIAESNSKSFVIFF